MSAESTGMASATRPDPAIAERALAEAEARKAAEKTPNRPHERGGPKGPEPVRYGDWEKKGIAVDF